MNLTINRFGTKRGPGGTLFGVHTGSGDAGADRLTAAADVGVLADAVPAGCSNEPDGSSDDVGCGFGGDCVGQPRWMSSGRTITHNVEECDCADALGTADAARNAKTRLRTAITRGRFGTVLL